MVLCTDSTAAYYSSIIVSLAPSFFSGKWQGRLDKYTQSINQTVLQNGHLMGTRKRKIYTGLHTTDGLDINPYMEALYSSTHLNIILLHGII